MYGTEAVAWRGSDSRGFWTKRKKSATSLLAVLALLAGIAVAFKLFDREVPNNVVRDAATFDFTVWKWDDLVGDTSFEEAGPAPLLPIYEAGVDTFPGDSRDVLVKIQNENVAPAKDASFQVHVDQSSIVVTGCFNAAGQPLGVVEDPDTGAVSCPAGATTAAPTTIPTTGTISNSRTRFLNFWTLDVDKELILFADGAEINEDEHQQSILTPSGSPDDNEIRRMGDACSGALRELTAAAPCNLGMIRAAGSSDTLGERTDWRYYNFALAETDDGTDQSAFKGWTVQFTLVFNARLPAVPESGFIGER